ncbi:MAG: tetratricopeptide repeat protein [Candidatus Aminicenantes bacterium]|nr:tetratricopeptide repeat protein [Candidatus Aminicenantes bacterium]
MKKSILALATVIALSACGPAVKDSVQTSAPTPEDLQAIRSARALSARGSYTALKEACRLFAGAYVRPALRAGMAADYLRAAFLLVLREKELALSNPESAAVLVRLVRENPVLAGYRNWPELAARINPRVNVVKDVTLGIIGAVPSEESERLYADLKARTGSDELAAYVYLASECPRKSPYDKMDDRAAIKAAHPDSILIKYRAAFCPGLIRDVFDEIIEADPEFWEAYGFRGEASLSRGELLTAEESLLIAAEHIPESAYYNILLASIYFLTEEFEKSLEYCDKSLAQAPEYRDAYLTKSICLSQLGRYAEALGVLDRIIQMQFYLQGEAHYWSAWNQHALKDLGAAQVHIEAAKGTLPTNSEVFGLAGTIALEKGELDRAEKDFKEALVYNASNHEAVFGLARIAEKREKWTEAAGFFEKAAGILAAGENGLKAKIEEIRSSGMPESRKAKMAAKKESQLRISQATRATAHYNAAAAWYNGGDTEAARKAAERAAEHPQLKTKASELLEKIK